MDSTVCRAFSRDRKLVTASKRAPAAVVDGCFHERVAESLADLDPGIKTHQPSSKCTCVEGPTVFNRAQFSIFADKQEIKRNGRVLQREAARPAVLKDEEHAITVAP
nr:hypothetical protein [Sinorhizobium saheli]